jgi:hypothetical protein
LEGDKKIQTGAEKECKFCPFDYPNDLIDACVYVHRRFFMLCGWKEMADLLHDHCYRDVYDSSMKELERTEYESIKVPVYKTQQVNLDNPLAPTKEECVLEVTSNPYDSLDPVKILQFFHEQCHPDAKRWYITVATPAQ